MSAPLIPNLNTLRRGGGRKRGRGRGALGEGAETSHETNSNAKDRIVQSTDNDAATSRLSAVEAGYLDDPFARLLTHSEVVDRRFPLMNRGTYVRTAAIDRLVDGFLSSTGEGARQIISLGAGSDTRFFRLRHKYPNAHLIYHEFDFPTNTAAKIRQMQTPAFTETVQRLCQIEIPPISPTAEAETDCLHLTWKDSNSTYHLHPLDLRTLTHSPQTSPNESGNPNSQAHTHHQYISPTIPTLLLSECCLIYLCPSTASSVLTHFTTPNSVLRPQTPLGVIIYEPIRPHDPFGRRMISNLTARGIQLRTLETYDGLEKQRGRLREALGLNAGDGMAGYGKGSHGNEEGEDGSVGAADVKFIWRNWVEVKERGRVEGLEWMDEVEEWELLASHYCVAWGWREGQPLGEEEGKGKEKGVFEEWTRLPVQEDVD